VTNSTPAMASSFSVPSARDLLVTFRTVTRRFYHRGAAKGKKDGPVLSNGESCFAVVDTIPIGCEAKFPETPIRYVDTLPLTSFREHELVHPLRRSVPARGIAPGLGWLSERCAP